MTTEAPTVAEIRKVRKAKRALIRKTVLELLDTNTEVYSVEIINKIDPTMEGDFVLRPWLKRIWEICREMEAERLITSSFPPLYKNWELSPSWSF